MASPWVNQGAAPCVNVPELPPRCAIITVGGTKYTTSSPTEPKVNQGAAPWVNVPKPPQRCVVLNVGGTKYMTSEETMKGLRLREDQLRVKDDEGNVFIDRDGDLFRYILNYLREKRLLLPSNFPEVKALQAEATFYGLENMNEEIRRYKEKTDTKWLKNAFVQGLF